MIARLDALLLKNWERVKSWFDGHIIGARQAAPLRIPIYTSVDLRNAGYKLAPVDTNIYPAGFNNLCTIYNEECVISFKNYIDKDYGDVKKILLITEALSKNIKLSFRNIPALSLSNADDTNTYNILKAQKVIISLKGLDILIKRIKKEINNKK